MRDIDSEHGAEVFHKEKRKRLGVITTRWIQTRESNEALDLMVMCLCILEMFRGTLDTMQPVIADQRRRTQRRFNSGHRRSSSMILSLRMHSGWCADLTTTHLALAHRPAAALSGNPRCQRLQDLTGLRCIA